MLIFSLILRFYSFILFIIYIYLFNINTKGSDKISRFAKYSIVKKDWEMLFQLIEIVFFPFLNRDSINKELYL